MKREKWRKIFDLATVKAGYDPNEDEREEWYPFIAKELSIKHLEFVIKNKFPSVDGWEGNWNPAWLRAVKDEFIERALLNE